MEKGVIVGVEHEATIRTTLPFAMFRTVTSVSVPTPGLVVCVATDLCDCLRPTCSYITSFATTSKEPSSRKPYRLRQTTSPSCSSPTRSKSCYTPFWRLNHSTPTGPTMLQVTCCLSPSISLTTSTPVSMLSLRVRARQRCQDGEDYLMLSGIPRISSRYAGDTLRRGKVPMELTSFFSQSCLQMNMLKTAGSYLLVLHNLQQLDQQNEDAVRLLQRAINARDWTLCRELLHFLRSIDDTGECLAHALREVGLSDDAIGVGLA